MGLTCDDDDDDDAVIYKDICMYFVTFLNIAASKSS